MCYVFEQISVSGMCVQWHGLSGCVRAGCLPGVYPQIVDQLQIYDAELPDRGGMHINEACIQHGTWRCHAFCPPSTTETKYMSGGGVCGRHWKGIWDPKDGR